MTRRTNMWRWFDQQFGDLSDGANLDRLLSTMQRYKRLQDVGLDVERVRRELGGGTATYGRVFDLMLRHHAERNGKQRWGDKSLHTEHHTARLLEEFPQAKIVHMIRDPRDRHASITNRYQDRAKKVASTTAQWIASTRAAARNVARYDANCLSITYEELAKEPMATLEIVGAFLDESIGPEMLAMGGAPEHASGNSSFEDFPPGTISTRSIGRYHKTLSPKDIRLIEVATRRHLKRYGYELSGRAAAASRSTEIAFTGRVNAWLAYDPIRRQRTRSIPASRLDAVVSRG